MKKEYAWRRFWVREGTELLLDGDAYLPDPENNYGFALNEGVFSFAETGKEACKILLGEPGMGKSLSLRTEFKELAKTWSHGAEVGALIDLGCVASLTDLRTHLCDNRIVRAWEASDHILHLCLDSLDEALSMYPGLTKALVEVIRKFPKQRLRLSVACRTGEFPLFLGEELTSHFGDKGVSRWYMAPLRRKDILLAATDSGLDAGRFLEAVWNREVQPLAARPITLDLLLSEAASNSELPSDIWLLYENGCRRLLSEGRDSSRFSRFERLDLDQRMAVAGRIACATIFGAYSAIDADPNATTQSGAVASISIAGGHEIAAGNPFAVGDAEIQEVLKKRGLFTAAGLQFRWSHKSFGEFLVAHHLGANAVTADQIMSLITCGGRVAPVLSGVTAWLTSRNESVFREVLRIDPEVLLLSDLSTATDLQKAAIVAWLLVQAEANNSLLNGWELAWNYRKLKHTGLKQQLEPVIRGPASVSARYCAIQVADSCGGAGLQSMLTDLALRDTEPLTLRIASASCVADHADGGLKARLLPLAIQSTANEEEERLQAQALSAVWPEHCTWTEIRDSLGNADYSMTTSLGRFVAFDLADGLPASDLADALGWSAEKDWLPYGLSAWAAATDRCLTKAAKSTQDPATRHSMVDVLFGRLSKHSRMFSDWDPRIGEEARPWPVTARRAIASELIPRFAPRWSVFTAALSGPNPLLTRDDVDFVIECWKRAPTDESPVWQTVVGLLVDWQDARAVSSVLALAQGYPQLSLALQEWQTSVRSNADRSRMHQLEQEVRTQRKVEERVRLIHDLLHRSASNSTYIYHLLRAMSFPLEDDYHASGFHVRICDLPGWQALEIDEQKQLIAAGKHFLHEGHPYTFRGLRHGSPMGNSEAAYRVLRELAGMDPAYLRELSTTVWERWTPAIVLCQCSLSEEHYGDADCSLLRFAAANAEGQLARTLGIVLRRGRTYDIERELERAAGALHSDAFESSVMGGILHRGVSQDTYLTGMRILLQRSHAGARRIVEEAPARIPLATADELPRLAFNVALWLEQAGEVAWPEAWRHMRTRPEFARLLLDVPDRKGKSIKSIVSLLSDEQLEDLYLWLREQFGAWPGPGPTTTEPGWTSQTTIVDALQQKRRATSVAVLEHLQCRYPDDWYLRKAVWDTKRLLIETSWEPIDPTSVKRIVEDRRQLLVRDEQELMEAVCVSLRDYQAAIREEGSRVMRLWNEPAYTPKPEKPLSREIAAELQRILSSRGVDAALESKIRDTQFADIYVSAVTSGPNRRMLSLIIEVKGCWNDDLKTALETQLAARYLKENHSRLGIYLVVWFMCDKWDGLSDSRKRKTPHENLSSVRASLEEQARRVNEANQCGIRVFILDATVEGPGPKTASGRRTSRRSGSSSRR